MGTNVSAIEIFKCTDPPMAYGNFELLEETLYKKYPYLQNLEISTVEHCDGKEFVSATIYFQPHITRGAYKKAYRTGCSRDTGKKWLCRQPTLLASFQNKDKDIKLWGGIDSDEAAQILQFIENLKIESFDGTFKFNSPISNEELSKYKDVYSVSKKENSYEVNVWGGKHGNVLEIQRVECGLEQCAFTINNLIWQIP